MVSIDDDDPRTILLAEAYRQQLHEQSEVVVAALRSLGLGPNGSMNVLVATLARIISTHSADPHAAEGLARKTADILIDAARVQKTTSDSLKREGPLQ